MFKYTLDNKRYYTLNYYYKTKYNSKVFKVSLNANFGCPNKKNGGGCIYCLNGSGENRGMDLIEQFIKVRDIMSKKWPDSKYIGYFQADTNTYAPIDILKDNYEKILKLDNVIGLNIATRCDCINDDVLDFQKFGKWLDDNWYEVDNDVMCIDKDILVKGNKEYRFDRMILVPHRINALFTKRDSERGDLPVGVYYNKTKNKYVAQCNIIDSNGSRKRKHLGYYDNSYNAFLAYKKFKEQYIKQVADEYKDKIPYKLYKAMYSWEVEITD